MSTSNRGAFIVLEGLDRSGKSTQVRNIVESLQSKGIQAKACRFPDRSTAMGQTIDAYLQQKAEMDDRSIHLLFSANRWERSKSILADLNGGTTVVCDRYAYSGIAFSAVKGLSFKWCQAPDIGLPRPDLVVFLDVSPEVQTQRGAFGEERYETSAVQLAVRTVFKQLAQEVGPEVWKSVDAGRDINAVEQDISGLVHNVLQKPLGAVGKLWEES